MSESPPGPRRGWFVVLISAAFLCSGAAALIFETLWFRQAGLTLGNSLWASSLVLAAFMGGEAKDANEIVKSGMRQKTTRGFVMIIIIGLLPYEGRV